MVNQCNKIAIETNSYDLKDIMFSILKIKQMMFSLTEEPSSSIIDMTFHTPSNQKYHCSIVVSKHNASLHDPIAPSEILKFHLSTLKEQKNKKEFILCLNSMFENGYYIIDIDKEMNSQQAIQAYNTINFPQTNKKPFIVNISNSKGCKLFYIKPSNWKVFMDGFKVGKINKQLLTKISQY